MEPSFQFDRLCIISDLHFGGAPGFQIFGSQKEMLWLINHLKDAPADEEIGLVINGDFIDFLAEAPAKHFDPLGAIAKLNRIAKEDTTFAPIFTAFSEFIRQPKRKLIINLGNHDLELALPWVRQRLVEILAGVGENADENADEAAAARLIMVMDGAGVFVGVGGKSVLCVHGNEVDRWNPADFEKLRQIGRDYQMGRPVEDWIPNAGTKMVIDVMNSVKRKYPFVDLLKPEAEAVVPILLACDSAQLSKMDNVLGLVSVAGTWFKAKVEKPRGMLGDNLPEAEVPRSNSGRTEALLASTFGNSGGAGKNDAQSMMHEIEAQVKAGVDPLKMVQGKESAQLGLAGAASNWLRNKPTSEVLREALEKLDNDRSFDPFEPDQTFTDLDDEIKADVDFLVAGHTHMERALRRRKASGAYFNSGTWARLIKIDPNVRQDKDKFAELFSILKDGNMEKLDAHEGLIKKLCTVVVIEADANGVLGKLCHVVTQGTVTALETVPKTEFRKG